MEKACRVAPKFRVYRRSLETCVPRLIKHMLPEHMIRRALQDCGMTFRRRVYTPAATVWLWLGQRLQHASCRSTVASAFAWAFANDHEPPSTDCSAYCRARQRLPEALLKTLTLELGKQVDQSGSDSVFGRPVILADGTTTKVADTPDNQQAYPQPSDQKPGCGFPMVRLVALFSLTTGALMQLAMGKLNDGEQKLFRSLWSWIPTGAIVVADRYFDSYRNVSLLLARGVDSMFRLNASRTPPDWRKRHKRLGKGDGLFVWKRPDRHKWAIPSEYDQAPATLTVRIIRYAVRMPGFKPKPIILVTTLLDPQRYPSHELAQLYGRRWSVELDINQIKTDLGMAFIDARSAQMVRKEIGCHMMSYNVVRQAMTDASVRYELPVDRVSFTGSRDLLVSLSESVGARPRRSMAQAYSALLRGIAQRPTRARPNRLEPRVIKRRKNRCPYMTQPRHDYPRRTKTTHAQIRVA